VLIATGIASGLIAAFIDVASDWLADLKGGVCGNVQHGGRFYLSRGFCCWGVDELEKCLDWRPWRTIFGIASAGGGFVMEYLVFSVLSVSVLLMWELATTNQVNKVLFAATASLLVRDYAVHAKHSGIPEIKTVLGGFVMRKFMGAWTLVIKSLGLVSTTFSNFYAFSSSLVVSSRCIGTLVGERGATRACCMLLRESLY
jgi:chloride channel 3/4/5